MSGASAITPASSSTRASPTARASAANQEADQLFSYFKQLGTDQAIKIVSERDQADAERRKSGRKEKIQVNLTNADIPRVVNGTADDADNERPFMRAFGPEYVKAAWDAGYSRLVE